MRCNEKETLSLGALLSQENDPPQASKPQLHKMMSSLGSMKSTIETSSSCSKAIPPPSPTDSVSESNLIASSDNNNDVVDPPTLLQSLKFDACLDAQVQSPDNSIWDSLFADQIDSSADFMLISSPRRDYMLVSSPRRDYMISSPKRGDYMISSPKRGEYMISSPKREFMVTVTSPKRTSTNMNTSASSMYSHNYGYVHGVQPYPNNTTGYSATSANYKGKCQSPLHKVINGYPSSSSSCSTLQYANVQGDMHGSPNLALPTMDALLDEYGLMYSDLKEAAECSTGQEGVYDVGGTAAAEAEAAVGGMTAALLEYVSMPSFNVRYGDHHSSSSLGENGYVMNIGGLMAAKADQVGVPANYHGLLGASACDLTDQEQDSGLQLVHHLLACAEAVAKDDYLTARHFLHHLNSVVSPVGDSMQRVASCFADALSARISPPISAPSSQNCPSLDTLKIYQILYQACPYIKFAHFTANQAIFEAFESEDRVHVIDLDILQGYQWPAFLQALAARPGGPPTLRITGVGYPAELVRETGRHLAELAHSLRVPFEFHPAVSDRLQDLRPHMLHRRVGEALAVNSVNRLHRVPAPHQGNLLAMIRDQAPNIVTLVEQEASHNGQHFLGRFLEALHYYSAIFDSIDATFPADSAARAKVEQCIFLPEIRNIVACEGPARYERHERLERWRKSMEGKGFKGVPLSQNAVSQSNILLGLYACDGYRLTEDKGCLLLGWQDRAIIAASAWRC